MDIDIETDKLALLRISTEWVKIDVISEVDVYLTNRGYIPVLRVIVDNKKIPRLLSIAAKSLAFPLSDMRSDNAGKFKGLKFELRKESAEKTALFEFR